MPASNSFGAFHVTVLALSLVPAAAGAAQSPAKAHGAARPAKAHDCSKDPVEIAAGSDSATLSLARCDGKIIPASVDRLSILARPASAAKPKGSLEDLARVRGPELAPGVRRLDARIVERLEAVVDHFRKDGETPRVVVVPSNKPRPTGSYHASGRAIDFSIEGVDNEDLAAFCKTMADTGCGFYPNEGFVHVDARDHGAGHASWIDASKRGEPPRYVSSWPPADKPAEKTAAKIAEKKTAGSGAIPVAIAAADEPKLPPLPAAAALAPLEPAKDGAKAKETVADVRVDGASPEAAPRVKDAAHKAKHRARRRRHHHPIVQNPS